MEEFIQEALSEGFSSYGFSSHAPLPFATQWTLPSDKVDAYLAEISRLKRVYGDRIAIYGGMEIDYLDATSHPASPYFQHLPLDFRIGSVHMMRGTTGEYVDIDASPEKFAERLHRYFDGDLRGLLEAYLSKLMRMVESGGFDIVGHADKMIFNAEYCQPGIGHQTWYRQLFDSYLQRIAQRGLIVEINTKKWVSDGVFFPSEEHFDRLRALYIPVTVNSDAHLPSMINSGRMDALRALYRCGIRSVMQLVDGAWKEVPINSMYR